MPRTEFEEKFGPLFQDIGKIPEHNLEDSLRAWYNSCKEPYKRDMLMIIKRIETEFSEGDKQRLISVLKKLSPEELDLLIALRFGVPEDERKVLYAVMNIFWKYHPIYAPKTQRD